MNGTPLRRLPLSLVATMTVGSLAVYPFLPDRVPIHWDRWGHTDGWASRMIAASLMPILTLLVVLVPRALDRLSPRGLELSCDGEAVDGMLACLAIFMTTLHTLMMAIGLGLPFPMHRIVPAGVGLLLATTGAFLRRLPRNLWVGIRAPVTLRSDDAWKAAHRAAGPNLVVGGMFLSVLGLAAPALLEAWVLSLIGLVLWTTVSALRAARTAA